MLTEQQRAARAGRIGSSDAAAILTTDETPIDPWRTQVDVWAELTGRVSGRTLGPAGTLGSYLEIGLLHYAADQLGTPLTPDAMREHPNGWMIANADALALDATPPLVVEAKSSGVLSGRAAEGWGDPGSAEVPPYVLVQTHHQLAVLDAQEDLPRFEGVIVSAILGGRGLALYRVPRSDELVDAITEAEARFWHDYVITDRQPPGVASLEALRVWKRNGTGPTVALPTDLVERWQRAAEVRRDAAVAEDAAKAAVLTALGDAERGTCDVGLVTYLASQRDGYTVAPTTVRTMRLKRPHRR